MMNETIEKLELDEHLINFNGPDDDDDDDFDDDGFDIDIDSIGSFDDFDEDDDF
ncbi:MULTISPECIES: hypothetical protein [Sphingobacterium]|uniref:Uncharacterized protein n=1 Tax=Sphingobacterium thermophilum TaxID=768534 RepID=A0ABP8QWN9_9SPHI|nr:hypothetical protein [Sphingobacterium sp. T2]